MDIQTGQIIAFTYNPDWTEELYGHAIALSSFDSDIEQKRFAELVKDQPTAELLQRIPKFEQWLVQRGLVRLLDDENEVMTWNINSSCTTLSQAIQQKQQAERDDLEKRRNKLVRLSTKG